MSWIKRLWYFFRAPEIQVKVNQFTAETHEVYDPFQDPDKIMKGEVESHFD
jgi:hypothetical protein